MLRTGLRSIHVSYIRPMVLTGWIKGYITAINWGCSPVPIKDRDLNDTDHLRLCMRWYSNSFRQRISSLSTVGFYGQVVFRSFLFWVVIGGAYNNSLLKCPDIGSRSLQGILHFAYGYRGWIVIDRIYLHGFVETACNLFNPIEPFQGSLANIKSFHCKDCFPFALCTL